MLKSENGESAFLLNGQTLTEELRAPAAGPPRLAMRAEPLHGERAVGDPV